MMTLPWKMRPSLGAIILLCSTTAVYAETSKNAPDTSTANISPAHQMFGDIAPKLADLTDDVLAGDIWERPQLSKRDRSLVTISALVALNRPEQLRSYLKQARGNGLTETELVEAITHMAFYSGWPSAVSAITIAKDVFQNEDAKTATSGK